MLRDNQTTWRRLNLLGDLLLTYGALLITIIIFKPPLGTYATGLLFILTLAIWATFLYGPQGSYFYRLKSPGKILRELFWALGRSFACFVAVIFFLHLELSSKAVLTFFVIDTACLFTLRFTLAAALNHYRRYGRSNRNVLIIGTGLQAQIVAERILDNKGWGVQIIGFLDYHRTGLWRYRDVPLLGHPDGLPEIIANNQVDFLIIAADANDLPLTVHAFAIGEEMGVTVCLMSDIYHHRISRAFSTNFMDFPSMVYSSVPDDRMQLMVKHLIDRLGGFFGLMISVPIGLIAAALIKLEDGGPIFFKQIRAGKNGKPFTMYKFRTMVPDAEKLKASLMDKNEMSGPVFKIKKDPRITRIGAILRKFSVDELPQFINVVRGDMSLVGPRPPLPIEVEKYDRWQRRKLSVKPGLTCLWQVNGRNGIDFDHWMKLDLEYIDNWSIWLDTKILIKTVPTVLKGNGAS